MPHPRTCLRDPSTWPGLAAVVRNADEPVAAEALARQEPLAGQEPLAVNLTTLQFAGSLDVAHLSDPWPAVTVSAPTETVVVASKTLCGIALFESTTPGWSRGGGQCGGGLKIAACPICVRVARTTFPGARIVGGTAWTSPIRTALEAAEVEIPEHDDGPWEPDRPPDCEWCGGKGCRFCDGTEPALPGDDEVE